MIRGIKGKMLFAVLLSVSITGVASTQDTLKVSLQKSLDIALSESPTIKMAEKEIQRVDYSNKERWSSVYPAISASGSYQRALKKQKMFFSIPGFPENPEGIEVGQDNTFAGVLSASMPIISPTLWQSLKLNETDAQLALESARSSKISLVNQVTKAYYAVLLAQDSYDVFERTFQNSAENGRIIASKFHQGMVSEFEWIRADVQVRNAQTNVVSALSAVEMSKLQLKMLIGVDMNLEIEVEGKLVDFEKEVFGAVLTVDASRIDGNTDLTQFEIRAEQLKQSLKIQKSQWLPSLAASVNYQYMTMANDDIAMKNYYWFPTSTAGLSLNIPLFQGGAKHYKAKQLKVQLSALEDQRENLRRSIELQAMSYTDNMIKAIEKIESNKKGLEQAEKALTISQKMYEVGAGTFLDVANAELGYVQSGLSYNQSVYDFISAKADLEKLLGTSINQ